MNTMKKIFVFLMIASAAGMNAQNTLRTVESFKNAVDYTTEAERLQNDGQYEPSLNKAKDADSAMDEAFIDALHLLLKKKADISRANAQAEVDTLEKSGALSDAKAKQSFQDAKVSIADGDALLQKAPEERSTDDKITEAYNKVISAYNKAEKGARDAAQRYLAQRRAEADKSIKEAQSKYSSLLSQGVLSKNDANGKRVDGALQAAQKALGANDFAGVASNVKSALDTMNAAEKAYAAEAGKVKKQLDDAQKRFSQLKNSKVIASGSADDKNITKLLSDASSAIGSGNFKDAQTAIGNAVSRMNAIESEYKTASAGVKKSLDDAQKRFSQLKKSNVIANGSADDKNITKLLSDASSAINAGNFKDAQTAIGNAVSRMNAIESEYKNASAVAKKSLDDAAARQKKLNASKLLPAGSDDDKEVSRLLELARTALGANNFKEVSANVDKARKIMDKAEKASAAGIKSVQDQLKKAQARHADFVKTYGLAADDPDNLTVLEDLQAAQKALAEGDWRKAEELIASANAKMDYLEKMLSDAAEAENQEPEEETQPEPEEPVEEEQPAPEPEPEVMRDEDGLPIDELGRVKVLPKYYVVRKRIPITDCMWRIAEMYFVYGDRNEWRRIYELNKDTFVQSENPHLILPGQILEIPPFKGEERDGTYNPEKRYVPFGE